MLFRPLSAVLSPFGIPAVCFSNCFDEDSLEIFAIRALLTCSFASAISSLQS
ncbi:hypothetical protein HanIR_Chr09g0402811 [Helianthus annuus]|nr:hypothetical protein HanIR_Chr09g0402811 [Helianthus annuus]